MMDQRTSGPLIFVCAGGTGGHVIPACVTSNELEQQGGKVIFVTDLRGQKYLKDLDPSIQLLLLPMGSRPPLFQFILQLIRCFFLSLSWVLKYKPKTIIGFGGFPSFPCMLAGLLTGRTLMVHEQNARLGRTNRFFKPFLKKLFLNFPIPTIKGGTVVGLPLRKAFESLPQKVSRQSNFPPLKVLILGGSQGASFFTQMMSGILGVANDTVLKGISVIHQAPEKDVATLRSLYDQKGIESVVEPFFDEPQEQMLQADMMIARSGASTVAEVIATQTPTVFIPLPSAMDNHQFFNASFVTEGGGGWVVPQNENTAQAVATLLQGFLTDPQHLEGVRTSLCAGSKKKVAQSLASLILSV